MSQQPESRFLTTINLRVKKAGIHAEKTHNILRRGTPDCYYSTNPRDLWCEYKYSQKLKSLRLTSTSSPCLSALQHDWLTRRHDEGRRVAVCVGFPQGGLFISPLDFSRLIPLAELESKIENRINLAERLITWLRGEHDDLFCTSI